MKPTKKGRMIRLAIVALVASLAAGLAAVAWGQSQGACPTCGGSSNANCCTCQDCSGNGSLCDACNWGSEGDHCKYVSGGCCIYHTRRVAYKNVPNPPNPCPCAAAGGDCGDLVTDVTSAYWHANKVCMNGSTQGSSSTEYDAPPYSCLAASEP
jgi:hypothetical protein